MAVGRVEVSGELLAEVLHFPPGTVIRGSVSVFLEHPDIRPVVEGADPPLLSPTFRRQDAVVFEGWGQGR